MSSMHFLFSVCQSLIQETILENQVLFLQCFFSHLKVSGNSSFSFNFIQFLHEIHLDPLQDIDRLNQNFILFPDLFQFTFCLLECTCLVLARQNKLTILWHKRSFWRKKEKRKERYRKREKKEKIRRRMTRERERERENDKKKERKKRKGKKGRRMTINEYVSVKVNYCSGRRRWNDTYIMNVVSIKGFSFLLQFLLQVFNSSSNSFTFFLILSFFFATSAAFVWCPFSESVDSVLKTREREEGERDRERKREIREREREK